MKKTLFITTLALSPLAYADTLYGLYADGVYWHTTSDSTQQTHANASTKFDHKAKGQFAVNASLEHGVPLVPNARMRYVDLNATPKGDTPLKLEADSTDVVAYYEILDNVVSVDLGLGVKRINGAVKSQNKDYLDLNTALPMAYASVGGKLPFTGLSAKAELGFAKSTKANATDALAEIKYNFIDKALIDVGVKAGYRTMTVNYDKVSYPNFVPAEKHPFEMNFKGPYLGVEVHF